MRLECILRNKHDEDCDAIWMVNCLSSFLNFRHLAILVPSSLYSLMIIAVHKCVTLRIFSLSCARMLMTTNAETFAHA